MSRAIHSNTELVALKSKPEVEYDATGEISMPGLNSNACRELRQKIQAHRIRRLGWSEYVLHFVMDGLGYGKSLTALDEAQLRELHSIISTYKRVKRPAEFNYDKQGRYMYRLQMEAGWSDFDLRAFLTITYRKTHWNLLDKSERAGLISILKSVIEANEPDNGTTTDTSTKLSVTGTHTEGTEGHGKVSSGGAQDSTDTTGSVCYNQESDKDIPF